MADRRSTYVFDREQDYEDAKNHLYHEMYSDYNNSDCIYFATKKVSWAKSVAVNKIENGGAESCISSPKNLISFIVE